MTRTLVFRDTLEVNGRTVVASGVRGKNEHVVTVKRDRIVWERTVKKDRRWPFGPALRKLCIEMFLREFGE